MEELGKPFNNEHCFRWCKPKICFLQQVVIRKILVYNASNTALTGRDRRMCRGGSGKLVTRTVKRWVPPTTSPECGAAFL